MSTYTVRPFALLLLIAAFTFSAPGSLWAAALVIDDTSPKETITISANDFEGGLTLNGAPFQQGLGNPASIEIPETAGISFSGTWITFGQQGPVGRTIFLIEAPIDPVQPPLVSDILRFQIIPNTNETATIEGNFISDLNDNLGTLPTGTDPKDVFIETGNPVDLGFVGLSLRVVSDVNVPEPSSFVLFGFALVGALGYCLRRKRFS